ncbi:sensor histidine kinase [Syntrophaceticus schinkii]|uniref:sensor histidine kinase n=1 Tax=Syntrophaceticus schinkii TaxID=499207 RepID=UPI001E31B737|nr:histidine kinase dimerization/phospho-acceptor domain-containing protein [Syntrophaceticus schinkii]
MLEINKQISKKYQGNPLKLSLELEKLEQNKGLSIFFIDQDYQLIYSTSMRIIEQPSILLSVQPKLNALAKGEYFTGILKDTRLETKFLVLASRLENNEVLVLSTPLAAIGESTAIANKFFLFTGLITIVIGGVAVFLFARSFTKPILQLNDIAQRMSKLDFSKKYAVQSDDEVGQLGKSINSLSDQLDKAIFSLTEANKKLKADIEQERRIDKMRKEFINNVSHELKTPIALIQGYAEGLKLNINEDEENKNYYCDVIMDEASKMNRLVKELLDLSQIESGSFKLDKTAFNLSS